METTTTTKKFELLDANHENIESCFIKIKEYADAEGYRILNALKSPTNLIGGKKSLHFDSKKQKKVLRNYINKIHKRVSMPIANSFLHFLFKKIYKLDFAPSIEYSEKEIKIKEARKAWVKARNEAEKLRLAYKQEKGDFYKSK